MKSLPRLDFVAEPRGPGAGIALALLALALLGVALHDAWSLRQTSRALTERAHAPAAPRAPLVALNEAQRRGLVQVKLLAGQMTAPWSDLLAVFEQHTRADIGLLRLEPDARSGRVRLGAEARSTRAMTAYLNALEADARLVDVLLVSHQIERDAPGKPVRFTLQAAWRVAPALTAAKGPGS